MADEFTSRRARREAERRAAEQAFEARLSSGQAGQSPADPAPQAREAALPASRQQAVQPFDATVVPPVRHERGPLAADQPVEEAPPQAAVDRRRCDDAAAPVREAEQHPQPQHPPAEQPHVRDVPPASSPSQPAAAAVKSEQTPRPAQTPMPEFATRAERRRYLREHGLVPAPADAPDETAGSASAAGPTAQDTPDAATADTEQAAAMTPRPPAPPVEESSDGEDSRRHPSVPARQATSSNLAGDLVDDTAHDRPHTMSPGAYAAGQPGTPAAPASESGAVPVEDIGTQRLSPEARPAAVAASPSAATQPAGSPLPAEPMSSPSAQQTVGGIDLTARRQRRAPVVKPPQTEGIRIVTGATQLARTQAAIDEARREDDAQTPAASHPVPGARIESSAAAEDYGLRVRAAGPMTTPIDAIPQEDLDKEVEGDAVESWDAPDAGEGDELSSPPAPPMSARQITHEDGDILYDAEPSKLPFIVLGAAGVVALILIIFALILIF